MSDFFHRLHAATPTRFWVNNPTLAEAQKALAEGAVGVTTNPTYCANMIKRDPGFALPVIDKVIAAEKDDGRAAHKIQQAMIARITPVFLPLHKADPALGFVSVQGDPHCDSDAGHIIGESLADRAALDPNFIAKIPVTAAGLVAIERMLRENIPVIATEVFALAQAIAVSKLYQRVTAETRKTPPLFITHITGIFDEYLADYARKHNVDVDPALLAQAGTLSGRRQYHYMKQHNLPGTILGGGARSPHHFTNFVGGDFHITINYSTAEELYALNPKIESVINTPADERAVAELSAKLPDLKLALSPDALPVDAFAHYGPVLHFLAKFKEGWATLKQTIRQRRR